MRARAHAVVDGSPGPVHADTEAKTPVASRAPNPQRGDSARRSEEKTPSAPTRTKVHRGDLDSARARRTEEKTGASAGSPGPARADAHAEIDGSRLKDKHVTLEGIDDAVLTEAYLAWKAWNVT